MALSTATLTETAVTTSGPSRAGSRMLEWWGTLAISASPGTYATGGLTMSFANFDAVKSSSLPVLVEIKSAHPAASAQANLYVYSYAPGTSIADGTVQIFTGAAAQTALTELSAGATPAGVSGDTIVVHAYFPYGI